MGCKTAISSDEGCLPKSRDTLHAAGAVVTYSRRWLPIPSCLKSFFAAVPIPHTPSVAREFREFRELFSHLRARFVISFSDIFTSQGQKDLT